jgi:hypothetical protein
MRPSVRKSALAAICFAALTAAAVPAAVVPKQSAKSSVYPTNGYRLLAQLSSAQAVPQPLGAAHASGVFNGMLRATGNTAVLTWTFTYRGVSGPVTAAHVHLGRIGKAGPIAIRLCPPATCRTGAQHTTKGTFGIGTKVLREILGERTYVNLHTRKNPAGELRGQVRVIVTAAG